VQGRLKDGTIVELTVDTSYARAAVRRGQEGGVEDSLLLEAVTRKRLVKTQQAGKFERVL
jgi:hypothetical protein